MPDCPGDILTFCTVALTILGAQCSSLLYVTLLTPKNYQVEPRFFGKFAQPRDKTSELSGTTVFRDVWPYTTFPSSEQRKTTHS